MKEIQGKINFGVIPVTDNMIELKYQEFGNGILFSNITEEQAIEFVEGCKDGFGNYENAQLKWFDTTKESLISLLKSNDVLIKEWFNGVTVATCCDEAYKWQTSPDDLLLIKL